MTQRFASISSYTSLRELVTSNHQITRWESKRQVFCFSRLFPPRAFKAPFTLSKALCATAPITLIPCAMISWNIYGAGSFRRHFEPFTLASSGQREEIAFRSGVLTRRSRMTESKRLISSPRAFLWERSLCIKRVHLRQQCISPKKNKNGSQQYQKCFKQGSILVEGECKQVLEVLVIAGC